jgi:RNase H-fold protein (predicted Holliday junction resolvase)
MNICAQIQHVFEREFSLKHFDVYHNKIVLWFQSHYYKNIIDRMAKVLILNSFFSMDMSFELH